MTNEEKATEIASKYDGWNIEDDESYGAYKGAMEMAEWKEQQFAEEKKHLVEKVCRWLRDNMVNYGEIWMGGWNSDSYDQDVVDNSLIRDLKKAMEE